MYEDNRIVIYRPKEQVIYSVIMVKQQLIYDIHF